MGMEPTGYARYHRDKLWCHPVEYQKILAETVEFLCIRGMSVSIYNLPRCVLPRSLWCFARQSISEWKNVFLPVCTDCVQRDTCAGFFESAGPEHIGTVNAMRAQEAHLDRSS
jgi:hypothetical protein